MQVLILLVVSGFLCLPGMAQDQMKRQVAQWQTTEITLTSAREYQDPFQEVEVTATFTGPGGKTLTRPAFWDGGRTWKIRFAPTAVGEWTMRTVAEPADAGLHNQTRTVVAEAYTGPHPIYKHGFLRASDNGRYLAYADGTPFFFLADTMSMLPNMRFSTSNVPGIASQFKHIIDTRVRQGFTAVTTQPIWGGQPGSDEPKANLRDGLTAADLPGFHNLDRKYAYIAEQGLVHANCQIAFNNIVYYTAEAVAPASRDPHQAVSVSQAGRITREYMAQLARYWVARYGAYPVIWNIAQETDGSYPQEPGHYSDEKGKLVLPKEPMPKEKKEAAQAKWFVVGDVIAATDAYRQPVMPYMASTQSPARSWWKSKPYHTGWFAQWSHDFSPKYAKSFWNHVPPKPGFAETKFDAFEGNNRSALLKAYKCFQNGIFGYSYGVGGIWNDLYSRSPLDVGTSYMAKKSATWHEGLNQKTGDQLTLWKKFYTALEWWKLEPRFDDPAWAKFMLEPKTEAWLATVSNQTYIVCFSGKGTATGQLLKLDDAVQYTARWFNPFDGTYTDIGAVKSSAGSWTIPEKPSAQDWLLLVKQAGNQP